MTDVAASQETTTPSLGDAPFSGEPKEIQLGPRTQKLKEWSLTNDKSVWERFIARINFLGLTWDETSPLFVQELSNFESLLPLIATEEDGSQVNKSDTEAVKQLTEEMEKLRIIEARAQQTDSEFLVKDWVTKLKKQGVSQKELATFEETARKRFSTELQNLSRQATPPDKSEIQTRISNAAIASLNLPRDADGSYSKDALGRIRQIQANQSTEAIEPVYIDIHNKISTETIIGKTSLPPSQRVLLTKVLTAQIQTHQGTLLDIGETTTVMQAIEALNEPISQLTGDRNQTNQYIDTLTKPGWQRGLIKQITNSPFVTTEGRKALVAKLSLASFEKTIEKAGIQLVNAEITKQIFTSMQQSPPQRESGIFIAQKAAGVFTDPFNAVFGSLAQSAAREDNPVAIGFAKVLEYRERYGTALFVSVPTQQTQGSAQKSIQSTPSQYPQPNQQQKTTTEPPHLSRGTEPQLDPKSIPPGMIAVVLQGTNRVPPPIVFLPQQAATLPPSQQQQIAHAIYSLQAIPQKTFQVTNEPMLVDQVLGISPLAKQEVFQWLFTGFKKMPGLHPLFSSIKTLTNVGGFWGRALGFLGKFLGLSFDAALFGTTGGIGNVIKTLGLQVGKSMFLDKLLGGFLTLGGMLTNGLGGITARTRPKDRRPWHKKIGLETVLAIIPIAVLLLIFIPTGLLGIGIDMIINMAPVNNLATSSIGGEETVPIDYDGPIPDPSKIEGCPVPGGVITQGPFGGFSHNDSDAYDFAGLPVGTPITATHDGYVESFRNSFDPGEFRYNSFGNYVRLVGTNEQNQQFFTIYGHLLDVSGAVLTASAQKSLIKAGTVIGTLDATGYSMGYDATTGRVVQGGGPTFIGKHLHYEYIGPGRLSLPPGCP